jgi:hypothetical protein
LTDALDLIYQQEIYDPYPGVCYNTAGKERRIYRHKSYKGTTMTDAHFQALHDRATRGERLSADEQAALETWYAQQDQAESQLLLAQAPPETLEHLRAQVATAAAQLETVSQRIREVLDQNEQTRHEIALLQRQLSQHSTDRAA